MRILRGSKGHHASATAKSPIFQVIDSPLERTLRFAPDDEKRPTSPGYRGRIRLRDVDLAIALHREQFPTVGTP